MLTGKEKIKDVCNDDICNCIGNSLCALGAISVSVKDVYYDKHFKQIQIKYKDGWNHMLIIDDKKCEELSIDIVLNRALEDREIHGWNNGKL